MNRKYKANKKNGGNIPAVPDERVLYVPVGCQNCVECRKQKARNWQIRLLEDIKERRNGKFITLTFSDESINEIVRYIGEKYEKAQMEIPTGYDLDNEIATVGIRLFLERWRKKYKKSLRHWLVTELGHNGTENIHLHGIVWTDENMDMVEEIWKYGYVWKGKESRGQKQNYVNEKTVNYIIKYVTKADEKHENYKSIILTSPGIGSNYTITGNHRNNRYMGDRTNETYKTPNGTKISLPVYWRNKVYTEEEREKLWLMKLNKEERWVMGVRIDVSKGDEMYENVLKVAREKNKRLGYGDGEKNYEKEQYERDRRILMQKTRIEKARAKEVEKVEMKIIAEIIGGEAKLYIE